MKIDIEELFNEPDPEYQKFHESTKFQKIVKFRNFKNWPKTWKTIYFKSYPRFEEILLPKPKMPSVTLKKALFDRKSERNFSQEPINLKSLSSLLYFSAGLRKRDGDQAGNRFYPSGGARYPLEVYVLSLNSDVPKGIYHYYLKSSSLEKIGEIDQFKCEEYFLYDWVKNASCLIIVTAVFSRSTVKYKDKGYIFSFIETGSLIQNFYLNAQALGLSICALAGFIEDRLNMLLDIDGKRETVVAVMGMGNKMKEDELTQG